MQMAIIGPQKGTGKRSRVREKSVKRQGILIWIMSGNPDFTSSIFCGCSCPGSQDKSSSLELLVSL